MASQHTKRTNRYRWGLLAISIVASFWIGFAIRGGGQATSGPAVQPVAERAPTTWTCSMHPQIKLPKAGQCPICFMDLIPLDVSSAEDLGPTVLVLSPSAVSLAEIQSRIVEPREVKATVRLIGKVDYDETRMRTISAWVPGRIDTLFVDFTGTNVSLGEPLVSIYSPELYVAQSELLNAQRVNRNLQQSRDEILRRTSIATIQSARERLKLWGLDETQIDAIAAEDEPSAHLRILSPASGVVVHKNVVEGMYVETGSRIYTLADLSRVWVTMNAYESDLAGLSENQTVDFTVEALPGREFSGKIVFIDPVLDNATRTVRVRVEADNASGLLKPGMFVNATVQSAPRTDGPPPLVIPASAALITGERAVVYVQVPDTEKPTFEGRVVVLGPRVGDEYIVLSGLEAGEIVVTKGNFKIDSALQIEAKPSMMNPDGGGPIPGHNHGSHGTGVEVPTERPDTVIVPGEIDDQFKVQLGELLQAYLPVPEALAQDDGVAAQEAARHALMALDPIDMSLVTGDAHKEWMNDLARLRKSFGALAEADDIEASRKALLPATNDLWATLTRFGYSQPEPVRRFHCPMANDNTGADWIQLPETTANPYFGSSMLRCGSQTDSLPSGTPEEGR